MNKKSLIVVTVLSVLSLALVAFTPVNTVSAAYQDYRGPNTDPDVSPIGDAICDETGTENNYGGTQGNSTAMWNGTESGRTDDLSMRGTGIARLPLTEAEIEGLISAIEEEYTARALYESIMATFGEVAPFAEIAASESNHAETLIWQAEKYGVDVPAYDPSSYNFPTFSTLDEAYQAGMDAEIADAALYVGLFEITTHSDLIRVYTNLQTASLENHYVSFETYLND